ncbi:MAG: Eco57I restriction-modification methylase domain-containing protein [Ignavibacteriae bacterium]|nr:Eco57I restriction-modification methylase domain-containing protein [Ignavibacteria bacterium]MBI3365305.1 Eco57I restriction-modification methylase domain-containing protein [Ignavibacteriota bacterium]
MKPLYLQEVMPEGRVKTSFGKELKEQTALFEPKSTLGKDHKEYASILDYIAEDEYKASAKEATKKPDYRFRIKGQTKFFVEAKKPFVDLSRSQDAIFQVKRYGFSGRVPVSILTDFEEFRVFDCTQKPLYEKPKLGVVKQLDLVYKQYIDEFDLLYDTFSRDAVDGGSLDSLTRKLLQKRTGDFALDKSFLDDLSTWRVELARDIAKHPRNRSRLNDYTLNESVQRILDRIVFFRVCEDREIEVENTLLAIIRMWKDRPGISLYSLLNDLFKQRRDLYNGLLFSPHECEELEVGNDVLLKIIENLNYPFSPYHFNEIGVEILGSIYEKFLGKTIHMAKKNVMVSEKPEVRKAGGVYYTPQYIVNYIVENTLGKLLYDDLTLFSIAGREFQLPTNSEPAGKVGSEAPSQLPSEVEEPLDPLRSKERIASPLVRGTNDGRRLLLSPKQVSKLKIIDIACGSGSFLLGAFQKLIDYHVEWYREHPKDIRTINGVADAYTDTSGNLRLSSRMKRDILLNNIYGVDIDRQAVEVTQMSLYLKVLEGETSETLNPQLTLSLKEVYLPSLNDNIKCGNSLIGTDIFAQGDFFRDEQGRRRFESSPAEQMDTRKINPFDWEREFPDVVSHPLLLGEGRGEVSEKSIAKSETPPQSSPKRGGGSGGFDVVIGNPPYVRIQGFPPEQIEYLTKHFESVQGNIDLYVSFVERGFKLLSGGGRFGMIVPNKFFKTDYGEGLRNLIANERSVTEIIDFGSDQVFEATTYTCLLFLSKQTKKQFHYVEAKASAESLVHLNFKEILLDTLNEKAWLFTDLDTLSVVNKLHQHALKLLDLPAEMSRGSSSGSDEVFMIKSTERKVEKESVREPIFATDFGRYTFSPGNQWVIIFPYHLDGDSYKLYSENELKKKFPRAFAYLKSNQSELKKRKQYSEWFGFSAPRNLELHDKAQIIVPLLADRGLFALIPNEYSGAICPMASGGFTITIDSGCSLNPKYVLGLLNSSLLFWRLEQMSNIFRGGWITCTKQYFGELPIRTIDFTKPEEKQMHDELVALVETMLELHKQLNKVSFDSEKEPIQRQIAATDKKINELVYKLYGLTEEEIGIVEK